MGNSRAIRKEYKTWGKGYYHLCTDRLDRRLLFNNDSQYRKGMAAIALSHIKFKVKVYTFELMPNHVHLILSGTGEQCVRVFSFLKRRFSEHLIADGYAPLDKSHGFILKPIRDEEEFKNQIIYCNRNRYEKNHCVPGGSKWGAGYLFFSEVSKVIKGTKAGVMDLEEVRRELCSRERIPDNWEIHPELGLLPSNFVEIKKVESVFRTPKDYLTRLVKEYETMVKIAGELGEHLDFSQSEVRDITSIELRNMYPGRLLKTLSAQEKIVCAVRVYEKLGIPTTQLAAALFISELSISQAIRSKDYGIRNPSKAEK